MSEQEQFQIPATAETESTDHDKEQLHAVLRETAAHIDTLIAEHGNFWPPEGEISTTKPPVGKRSNVYVGYKPNPDTNITTYSINYSEAVIPRQPVDTGEAGYDPYDFKHVSFEWQLDADGNPVESEYSTADPYSQPTEENTTRGDLIVIGFGEERVRAAVDAATALEAMQEANDTVATAEAADKLGIHDESAVEAAGREQEPVQKKRFARLRTFGRNVITRNK